MVPIVVEAGDVLRRPGDVLVLKCAQDLYGVDRAVASLLGDRYPRADLLKPGAHVRIPAGDALPVGEVLVLGVRLLWEFEYADIRKFAFDALMSLGSSGNGPDTIIMTMHGAGCGLDEREAFTAQIAGLLEYLTLPEVRWRPRQIVIVELDRGRAQRMQAVLSEILREWMPRLSHGGEQPPHPALPDAGGASRDKKHVFVAMPYDHTMEDVYEFGIRQPVNSAGLLCERCDHSVFTGDILDRVKQRIASATLVLADVSGANPNVYLEIGYAWGRGVPTLLVAKDGQDLHFDLKTQRCMFYKNITHLRKQLAELLPELVVSGAGVPAHPAR